MKIFLKWQGLILASLFCALVLMARISVTGSLRYSFLLWNLFLAFIPLFISDYLLKKTFAQKYKVLLGIGVWLLFFPNAPYIITDLMHLTKSYRQIPWLDSVLIFSFAITALTIGLISLFQVRIICMKNYSFKFQSLVWLIVFPLTGFGVYLGRFERWNSWDLLTNPFGLLQNCLENLVNVRAMAITFVFGGCLFITQQLILQASKTIYDTDKKCLNSFRFAYNGIKHCARTENNFRVHLLATAAVLLAGFYSKLSKIEWCMIVFAIGLVLVTELVNSAIEKLVDLVSPERNVNAGVVKDMAAGAVLAAAIVAYIIGLLVFLL